MRRPSVAGDRPSLPALLPSLSAIIRPPRGMCRLTPIGDGAVARFPRQVEHPQALLLFLSPPFRVHFIHVRPCRQRLAARRDAGHSPRIGSHRFAGQMAAAPIRRFLESAKEALRLGVDPFDGQKQMTATNAADEGNLCCRPHQGDCFKDSLVVGREDAGRVDNRLAINQARLACPPSVPHRIGAGPFGVSLRLVLFRLGDGSGFVPRRFGADRDDGEGQFRVARGREAIRRAIFPAFPGRSKGDQSCSFPYVMGEGWMSTPREDGLAQRSEREQRVEDVGSHRRPKRFGVATVKLVL